MLFLQWGLFLLTKYFKRSLYFSILPSLEPIWSSRQQLYISKKVITQVSVLQWDVAKGMQVTEIAYIYFTMVHFFFHLKWEQRKKGIIQANILSGSCFISLCVMLPFLKKKISSSLLYYTIKYHRLSNF